jgi:MurNAc alpha-1-phosphate uridylyltransferase
VIYFSLTSGCRLEGVWMHVGTPDAIARAEAAITASAA